MKGNVTPVLLSTRLKRIRFSVFLELIIDWNLKVKALRRIKLIVIKIEHNSIV